MRIATWNVNSLKARLPRVEEWLEYAQPDVLCLQETKLADKKFPSMSFSGLGYDSAAFGHNQWNGVAILSKVGIEKIETGFGDGFVDPYEGDARLLSATCGGIRMISVYVPNGRTVPSDFYDRKLEWLEHLAGWLEKRYSPSDPIMMMGDFNVAPEDRDLWDPKAFVGSTHVTPPERAAVARLTAWGLVDTFRSLYDGDALFTYWDYRRGDFHEHRGMRIDLALATKPVADRAVWAIVDRNARKGKLPSDHAPLVIDLAD
ncbi:MAG TPA: exodeoxyribonuclease III [Acidimicrobiia bacterium]